jgi:TonB family protein
VPATLLERAVLASRAPQGAAPRRTRTALVAGGFLLAGAAFAAGVTIMSLTRERSEPAISSAEIQPTTTAAPAATLAELFTRIEATRARPQGDGVTSVELVETALSSAPIVRRAPDYPLDALRQRLGGHVQVKYDVTAAGVIENVRVVESSDAMFEDSAVRAVSEWRYLPRIVAGKRVATNDVYVVIRFEPPDATQPPADQRQVDAKQEAAMRDFLAFSGDLEVAVDRLAADDLRGAELQLDEMQAIYGAGYPDLWSFYGYLFTVQGNYGRAIDAYDKAVSAFVAAGAPWSGPWAPLANLYFARHQYDMALNTLVRQQAVAGSARISGEGEVKALIAKLRALGLTHESLEAR